MNDLASSDPMPDGDDHVCPICAAPINAGEICATDIELGMCHAACLEGSPTVDLNTGEPVEGPIPTYVFEGTPADKGTDRNG